MPTRTRLHHLWALALLLAGPATAGQTLWNLEHSVEACIQKANSTACSQAQAQIGALTRTAAYGRSSHLCKEEIGELSQLVSLLPRRDAVPNEVMASVADVQQACLPFGY